MDKSRKYESRPPGPKQLLLYTTHFRFNPNDVVLALIEHELRTRPHIFDAVFLLRRFSQTEAMPMMLWPEQHIAPDFDPADYADHGYFCLSPEAWATVRGSSDSSPT